MEYLLDTGRLLKILRAFSPRDEVKFGGKVHGVAQEVYWLCKLNKSEKFAMEALISRIKSELLNEEDRDLKVEDAKAVVDQLINADLVKPLQDKDVFRVNKEAQAIIGDLFSLDCISKWGRIGLLKYLLDDSLRTVQWCCIHIARAGRQFSLNDVTNISGLSSKDCKNVLNILSRSDRERGRLTKSSHQGLHGPELHYELQSLSEQETASQAKEDGPNEEEKMLKELLRGYTRYQNYELGVKDTIIEILKEYGSLSGADLHRRLKDFGQNCSQNDVYTHLKTLRKKKKIKNSHRDVSDKRLKKVELLEKDEKASREELLANINGIFEQIGVKIRNKFFLDVQKEKTELFMLRLFYRQLLDVVIARDASEFASLQLWNSLLNNLEMEDTTIDSILALNESGPLNNKKINERKHCISPAFSIMLRFAKKSQITL